ncbi:hypothetical protein C451_11380 [Halococcus thailandensis JCM 13552]|uniref:Uncharacterized protein n=2 Tax=Halococcus thailandensis TaxID=335952 RepID=M0N7D6_9EURY|nr:hypothetical protein C451_11380 [Halococcus thailandensis JCM 13552]
MGRLRRGWEYYRRYTKQRTGIHAAATAALTGLGLLAYFEQWFVAVAIVAYLLPPVYLYLTGDDLAEHDRSPDDRSGRPTATGDRDSDSDGIDRDSDSDGIDRDSDSDGIDRDSDSDGTDTDSDSDGNDADADADGYDADADADGADADADGTDADADADG